MAPTSDYVSKALRFKENETENLFKDNNRTNKQNALWCDLNDSD